MLNIFEIQKFCFKDVKKINNAAKSKPPENAEILIQTWNSTTDPEYEFFDGLIKVSF